ncbi:hypothetical protein VE00_10904 [Pseudogymnoascus sp. WSF 3629]|nr:hypothetical protein VE00_10904 [Pseudogymnoascus sp. WSF 3629]
MMAEPTYHYPIQRKPMPNLHPHTTGRYVALLRKQKATVWCDRAQHLDPRHVAAQRAAKARAHLEVAGAPDSGRAMTTTSTAQSGLASGGSRVAAKIRHHGKAGLVGYAPAGDFGVGVGGVPMRLSATEVEGEDSDGEDAVSSVHHHRRTGSGRSSLGSSKRGIGMRQSGSGSGARWSGGTPSAAPTPRDSQGEFDVVVHPPGGTSGGSMASGSSAERGDAVPELDAARFEDLTLISA